MLETLGDGKSGAVPGRRVCPNARAKDGFESRQARRRGEPNATPLRTRPGEFIGHQSPITDHQSPLTSRASSLSLNRVIVRMGCETSWCSIPNGTISILVVRVETRHSVRMGPVDKLIARQRLSPERVLYRVRWLSRLLSAISIRLES
jgi:hypothetical protein